MLFFLTRIGGYSYVFLVKDMVTGEDYALKRLLIQDKEMYKNAKEEIDFMVTQFFLH